MKILHISPYALRGGCEKNCYHFIQNSPEFDHRLIVLGQEGPMSEAWGKLGTSVIHLNILGKNLIKFRSTLLKSLENQAYDLVIYWSTVRIAAVLSSLKKASNNVKIYLGNPSTYSLLKLINEFVQSTIWSHSKNIKLMACSNYVAESFRHLPYFSQFPIHVSLNPVKIFPDNPKKSFSSDDHFQVGMVARLDPIKNHKLLIRAFLQVQKVFQNMTLHLVGDGILRDELKALAESLGLLDRVIFHGDVDEVYKVLVSWDVFVYSTTPKEGLGSVVIESMANGIPCLLPNLPMMKELAPKGVMVRWFEYDNLDSLVNEWIEMFRNKKDFSDMSNNVYHHSLLFSPRRFISDYVSN